MTDPAQAPVLLIVGPTASGKTVLAVELAKRLEGEVVSADSRQVYRFMDVGTAKPTAEERAGVEHHGFDVVDPAEPYSAGRFAAEARRWIAEIQARGKHPIVAGGSGLYLQALVDGFFAGEDVKDEELRADLEARADREGLEGLYADLKQLDPVYADKTLPGDRQRILRALEVTLASGEPFSSLHERERDEAPFASRWFGLDWPRNVLYERIDRRVEEMLDHGLVKEVRDLLDRGYRDANAMKSVGYEEIVALLEGRLPDLAAAVELIQRNTRRFAKRQLTWFRREDRITWLDPTGHTPATLTDQVLQRL